MKPIIKVEGLGKQYRVGSRLQQFATLRDSISAAVRKPLAALRPNGHSETFWALRDVDFEVAPGEVIGVIGRNGAGKSTLLKILSRITEPTTGRVELYGRVASLLEVGTGFHPELTGRENVFLNGAVLGMRKAEIDRKFEEIVAFAEIERFIDTPVKHYSSGMYVRLAFAVAAHLEPEILIIDEVLAVGDAQFQKRCLGKMNEVARSGRTVLFVSHNMRAVAQLCGHCIWIDGGQVMSRGLSNEVVVDYLASSQPQKMDGLITKDMHYHDKLEELSFTRIDLLDKYSNPTIVSYFGDSFRFRVEFEVLAPLKQARLGLVINKFDETVVCAVQHTDTALNLLNLQPGNYVAHIQVDVPLVPGPYYVALFAKPDGGYWTSAERSLDYIAYALAFNVEEVSAEGGAVLPTNALIHPVSNWTVEGLDYI
jgi:homopolymeric O-antigen transport system ATP-binding protein